MTVQAVTAVGKTQEVQSVSATAKSETKQKDIVAIGNKVKDLVIENFPVVKKVEIVVTSSALQALGAAAVKTYFAKPGCASALTTRANYLEATAISLATFIHNIVMAVIFSVAAGLAYVFTLGKGNEQLNHAAHKYWTHAVFSAAGIGIGIIGTVSPSLGQMSTLGLYGLIGVSLVAKATKDLEGVDKKVLEKVKDVYKENRAAIVKAILDETKKNEVAEADTLRVISIIDKQMDDAKSLKDFVDEKKGVFAELSKLRGNKV